MLCQRSSSLICVRIRSEYVSLKCQYAYSHVRFTSPADHPRHRIHISSPAAKFFHLDLHRTKVGYTRESQKEKQHYGSKVDPGFEPGLPERFEEFQSKSGRI